MELKGQRNKYVCEKCGGEFITVNLVDGVTPYTLECRANWPEICSGLARSQFYRIDQTTPAGWGWYRPDGVELERLEQLHPGTKDYVKNGCLILRKLDGAERETYGGVRARRG